MHELSITRNIVAIVAQKAAGRSVKKVRLQIGKLAGIEIRAIQFCYPMCASGTVLEGSELEVDVVQGRAHCDDCGDQVDVETLVALCPCGKRGRLRLVQGEELLVKEMEVA